MAEIGTPDGAPRFALPLLVALTALGSLSVSIYLPALPVISDQLNGDAGQARLTLSGFLVVFALAQLCYGPLGDRIGRKPPILAGIALYVAGSLACAAAPSLHALIAARLLQAAGASAGPALGRAVLRDIHGGPRLVSALAVVTAAVALSPMLGPFIGSLIATHVGWRAIFVMLAVVGVVLAAGIAFLLPETLARPDPASTRLRMIASRYVSLLRDSEYAAAVMCGGLLTAGNFAWNAAAPFLLGSMFGIGPQGYGWVALLVGSGYAAGTLAAGRIARSVTASVLVYGGLACSLTGGAVLWVAALAGAPLPVVVLAVVPFTLGMGVVVPAAAACALSRRPEIAGSAAGMMGALQILTGAAGTAAVSLLAVASLQTLGGILLVSAALATVSGQVALAPLRGQRIEPARVDH